MLPHLWNYFLSLLAFGLSYPILSYPDLAYPDLSCPLLSYPIPSYPILWPQQMAYPIILSVVSFLVIPLSNFRHQRQRRHQQQSSSSRGTTGCRESSGGPRGEGLTDGDGDAANHVVSHGEAWEPR